MAIGGNSGRTGSEIMACQYYYNVTTGLIESARTPTTFKSVSLTTTGNLWTPASGKKFRLMSITYQLPEGCTLASAGELTVKLQDGSGNDIGINFIDYLQNTVPGNAIGDNHVELKLLGNGYISTTADNVLVANFSAALTAGHAGFIIQGTEE